MDVLPQSADGINSSVRNELALSKYEVSQPWCRINDLLDCVIFDSLAGSEV